MTKGKRGFTLIELVVVIAVLGILAGIAIPRFLDAQASAKGAKVIANLRSIDSAANIYMTKNGRVPHDLSELTSTGQNGQEKLLDIAATYDGGEFLVTTRNGTEKRYTDSGSYAINSEGRGVLQALTHTADYYLDGGVDPVTGTVAANISSIANAILTLKDKDGNSFLADMDSVAAACDPANSRAAQFEVALKEQGIDLAALGAVSWSYHNGVLSWTSADISAMSPGDRVITMSYNVNTNNAYQGLYAVWISTVVSRTAVIGNATSATTYNIIDTSHRTEYSDSKNIPLANKKDVATMQQIYDNAVVS